MVEYSCKIEEKVKAMKSEIRKMYREPTLMGRKLGLKSMVWTRRKKINSQLEENGEIKIQKNQERLRNLQENFKRSNI